MPRVEVGVSRICKRSGVVVVGLIVEFCDSDASTPVVEGQNFVGVVAVGVQLPDHVTIVSFPHSLSYLVPQQLVGDVPVAVIRNFRVIKPVLHVRAVDVVLLWPS